MSKRVFLLTISLVGALASLTLLTFALKAHTSAQATISVSPVFVSITENGFDPVTAAITVGGKVVWTNLTEKTAHLVGGEPRRIYLPLVVCNVDSTRPPPASPQISAAISPRHQVRWIDVEISPGKSHTQTFTRDGYYPYYLTGRPDTTGLVIVKEAPDFKLEVRPAMQTVTLGHSVNYIVAVTAVHGFTQAVTLTVGSAPTGTTISWTTNPITPPADTTLTITPSMSTSIGTYMPIITGTGGGHVHSIPFTLTVLPCAVEAWYECRLWTYIPPPYCECTNWGHCYAGEPYEQWVAYTDLTCESGSYSAPTKYHYSIGFLVGYTITRTYSNSGNTYVFEVECSFEHPYQGTVTGGIFGTEMQSFNFSHERFCSFCMP